MPAITPFLWFDGRAEEAASFYVAAFPRGVVKEVMRWGEGAPAPKGAVMSVTFAIEDRTLIAFNGGPRFAFSPAISMFVGCETQDEVDTLWDRLAAGGATHPCGWLTDRFGVSWQIVPTILGRMLQDEDPARAQRVMAAMLQMSRFDIAALRAAFDGR